MPNKWTNLSVRTIVVKQDTTVNFTSLLLKQLRAGPKKQAKTFRLTHPVAETTFAKAFRALMRYARKYTLSRILQCAVGILSFLLVCAHPVLCQDSSDQGTMSRGDRAEIAVTVRNSTGEIITAPATIKLYKNGIPTDQSSTSHGRAFFIPRSLGEYTVMVEAAGYKNGQKDVSVSIPIKEDVEIVLQRDLASNETGGVPGKPLLAPKAKEALEKGLQAIRDDKLNEAQKYLSEAMKLAPGNPEVLYAQGVLDMRQRDWAHAQTVLEKSAQIEANQPRVLAALGMALCNQKKYEAAIPPLEKSLQLEPTAGWETEWALAKAYYYHEQYEQALKMVQQAQAYSHGATPQVELLLAQCLTAAGRFEDAAGVLRAVLKNNADSPEAATARQWLDRLTADGKIHREGSSTP
jgi:Flp pilus assembly protein TadD